MHRETRKLIETQQSPYLWRRQGARIKILQRLGEQLVPKDGAQMASHDRLLLHRAVVLQGQDQGVRRCLGERFHSVRGQNRWIIQR